MSNTDKEFLDYQMTDDEILALSRRIEAETIKMNSAYKRRIRKIESQQEINSLWASYMEFN